MLGINEGKSNKIQIVNFLNTRKNLKDYLLVKDTRYVY